MAVGQRAELRFDAYPDVVLKGHVASIGAGTGADWGPLRRPGAEACYTRPRDPSPHPMNFDLTESQRLTRDMVREFAEREVRPFAAEIDRTVYQIWEGTSEIQRLVIGRQLLR